MVSRSSLVSSAGNARFLSEEEGVASRLIISSADIRGFESNARRVSCPCAFTMLFTSKMSIMHSGCLLIRCSRSPFCSFFEAPLLSRNNQNRWQYCASTSSNSSPILVTSIVWLMNRQALLKNRRELALRESKSVPSKSSGNSSIVALHWKASIASLMDSTLVPSGLVKSSTILVLNQPAAKSLRP